MNQLSDFTDFIYLWLSLDGSGDGPLYILVLFHEVVTFNWQFNGLVQERHNSSALAVELCLSCTNPPIYTYTDSNMVVQTRLQMT